MSSSSSEPSLLALSTYLSPTKLATAVSHTAPTAIQFLTWLKNSASSNPNLPPPVPATATNVTTTATPAADLTSDSTLNSDILNTILCSGFIPDSLIRFGIRTLLSSRIKEYSSLTQTQLQEYKQSFVNSLKSLPIALAQSKANSQHYEVPASYYTHCLGANLKYSCCLFPTPNTTLTEAELHMLDLYCERAELEDGQCVLDLGCGWGSFSLFAAAKYRKSFFIGMSNSQSQREFIMKQARLRGLDNVVILTRDATQLSLNDIQPVLKKQFNRESKGLLLDRIVSVEMLEHMKNYGLLFKNLSTLLKPSSGKLFVHIFTHKSYPYHFQDDNWLSSYFFSGGTMPCTDLLHYFQDDLSLQSQWIVSGHHYATTCKKWLELMDQNKTLIMKDFISAYGGVQNAQKYWQMWRVFYMSCEELMRYNDGEEWFVTHYLFQNKD